MTELDRQDLFKKIGDIKRIFHARMCMIKDRNSKNLKETEEIKERWQEYTEKLYKKDPNDPDNHSGVVTHLDIRQWMKLWAQTIVLYCSTLFSGFHCVSQPTTTRLLCNKTLLPKPFPLATMPQDKSKSSQNLPSFRKITQHKSLRQKHLLSCLKRHFFLIGLPSVNIVLELHLKIQKWKSSVSLSRAKYSALAHNNS